MPPLVTRILSVVISAAIFLLALWLMGTLFFAILIAAATFGAFFFLRQWLLEKGILNPNPGVPMAEGHIIEGEFEQIENPMVRDERTEV